MGLLDMLGSDVGLLGLNLMAAGSAKPVRTGFGEGLLQSLQAVQAQREREKDRAAQEQDRAQRKAMQDMQMQQILQATEARKKAAEQEHTRQGYLGSIDPSQGPAMPISTPRALAAGLSLPEINAMTPQGPKRTTLKPGEQVFDDATGKPLFGLPAKPDQSPLAKLTTEMEALPPGSPLRKVYQDAITKATTHQPATSVSVNTEKPLLNTVASKLGEQIDTSLSQARAASQAITTAQTIKGAVDSGKVVAGPGASFRVAGLQIGQMLGVGGKDAAEVLSNTRTVIQSMAKAELDAAQQMKGQGQITETERDIIRRAASGNIDSLTTGEVRQLADVMEKTARFKIGAHQSNVKALGQMPGAASLLPFYQVEAPAPYEPQGQPRVRKYNPATGRLE